MKKIVKTICIFLSLIVFGSCNPVQATSTQASRPAMPYTKQASDKLAKVIIANQNSFPTIRQNATSSETLELYIKYFIKIWGIAGYDFRKSVNKYVHDMKIDPIAMNTPPTYEYTMPIILAYLKISDTCSSNQDILVLKKYFSQEVINNFSADISRKLAESEKPQYWFPPGIVSYMLTDMQMKSYEVVSENTLKSYYNMDSLFIQQKIKEAKMQGRPFIRKDLEATDKDYQILKEISLALNDGMSQKSDLLGREAYGSLSQDQEVQLSRILNEYGDSVLDDKLKSKLQRYRQRQAHMGTQDINKTSNQYQFTNMPNPSNRSDVERFYNGGDYTPVVPCKSTIKNNILQNGVGAVTNYALNYLWLGLPRF